MIMQITDIKVRKFFDEGPMKAIASVTFDDCLAVHDVKVIYSFVLRIDVIKLMIFVEHSPDLLRLNVKYRMIPFIW